MEQTAPNPQKQWTAQENLTRASQLKTQGNHYFLQKQFKEALRAYHKAILHLAGIIDKSSSVAMYTNKTASEEIAKQSNQIKFAVYMNMSQIYINQEKWDKGLQMYALRLQKAEVIQKTAKFFYRRAICFMHVSEFEQAKVNIDNALALDPSLKEATQKLLMQMQALEKKQYEKQKAVYSKLFK